MHPISNFSTEKLLIYWNTFTERDTFFRALSSWMGFKRITFPFEVDERKAGGSKWGFLKLARLSLNARDQLFVASAHTNQWFGRHFPRDVFRFSRSNTRSVFRR